MKMLFPAAILTCCLGLSTALAQQPDPAAAGDAKPTAESIRQLLDVLQARAMVDALPKQMDAYFNSFLSKFVEGQSLSAEQQKAIEKQRQKLADMMQEVFNWPAMESIYQEVYGKTFSQSEIDSMIAYYSSPAGHAVVVKLPLAMQNSMAVMQQRMQALIPTIQQMAKDTAAQIKAPPAATAKDKSG